MIDYYKEKLQERKQEWWEWHKNNPKLKPFKEEKEIQRLEEVGFDTETRMFG